MSRNFLVPLLTLSLGLSAASALPTVAADKAPTTWDNMVQVKSTKMDVVFLLPGADFRGYTKVMLDPPEAAFRKNFLRDYNNSSVMSLDQRLRESDIQRMLGQVREGFGDIFKEAYEKAGYEVVTTPGPDVLRVRTGVADLFVNAPDVKSSVRTRSYSPEAGQATLVLEARDSVTNALLGRAVDKQTVGDVPNIRNSVSNRTDFEATFKAWAKRSVEGLAELKARSPIPENPSAK